VQFEVRRQSAAIDNGEAIRQETRGWNEQKEASYLMRVKESENDYRYFPDPDLLPMVFTEDYIEGLRASLPELPLAKIRRYQSDLGLSAYDASLMTADRDWAFFFEDAVSKGGDAKAICNWMNSDFAKMLNEEGKTPSESRVTSAHLVDLTTLISNGTLSGKMAKDIFAEVYATGKMASEIAKEKGVSQITDSGAITPIVEAVLAANPEIVAKYKAGNVGVKGFLVGQVMKQSQGRANPQMAQDLVQRALED
jgi:aspartyl-tRNA(Asn)/glutamyl-tRNA(Gln) amidotransferase subunit B